jgi:recombination protein RecR
MKIPKAISDLIDSFQKLPGIGPKTAQRHAFYLLHVPQSELDLFAQSLSNLKKNTVLCSLCKNVTETDPCYVCLDTQRDQGTIMVVEQPIDLLAFERSGKYHGLYHVLHGVINPLENIGPDEIFINELFTRVTNHSPSQRLSGAGGQSLVTEIILAMNPTMEGDATAMYINGKIKAISNKLTVSRLGMGIPTGADLEYADEITLKEAILGRREM